MKSQTRPVAQQGAPDALLFVIVAIAAASGAVALWMGEAHRELAQILLWDLNSGALVASVVVVIALVVPLILAAVRAPRALTDEHRRLAQRRQSLPAATRRKMLVIPAIMACILCLIYVAVWLDGTPRWVFTNDVLPEPWPNIVEKLSIWGGLLTGPLAFVAIIANVLTLWRPIRRRWEHQAAQAPGLLGGSRRLPDPGTYQLLRAASRYRAEKWRPWPTIMLGAREYELSRALEPEAQVPSWVEYGGKTIFGGLLIFGMKGSGKTALLKRAIEDIIKFRCRDDSYKPALVAIDPKGDLSDHIVRLARRYGRSQDVTRLGVGTRAKWNPFAHLNASSGMKAAKQAGFFLRCAMPSTSDGSYWEDNADLCLSYSIHLLSLAGKTVSFASLSAWITRLKEGDEEIRNAMYCAAEANLANGGPAAAEELLITHDYFEEEFCCLDAKPRGIVVNTATNFLRRFEALEYRQAFCGSSDQPGQFEGFEQLIKNGGIFVLDVRSNEDGAIASVLSMLAKLYYQAAVKTRDKFESDWHKRPVKRVTATIWDEYQSYVTPSAEGKQGDAEYLETSRSFYAIDIAATQQYSSIAAATRHAASAQRIVGSFNNLVVFRHNDHALTEYTQQLVGRDRVERQSYSVTEGAQVHHRGLLEGAIAGDNQSVTRSLNSREQEEEKLSPRFFGELMAFEAVGIFSDPSARKVTRFCTKPYFVSLQTPHERVVEKAQQEGSK